MAAFPAGNAFPVPDCRDVFHHLRPASLDSGSRPENDRANGFRTRDAPYNSLRHGDHLSRFGNRVGHVPAFHSLFRLLAPAHLPPGMGCPAHWRKTHAAQPCKMRSFLHPSRRQPVDARESPAKHQQHSVPDKPNFRKSAHLDSLGPQRTRHAPDTFIP